MRPSGLTVARIALGTLTVLVLGYLASIAVWPDVRQHVPAWLQWFGQPNSAVSIMLVVVLLVLLGAVIARTGGSGRTGAPVAIVVGLALISAALGMASYWRCRDESNPTFFTPLIWTAGLVKGGDPDKALAGGACPAPTPVALDIAQLSALAALFLSVIGVAVALFQSRLDRLRAYFARSVTAVVDLDEDSASLVPAIARTLGRGALVVVTSDPDRACVREARPQGARVVTVDFNRPETVLSLPFWRKLDRLYLLSADPSTNLVRLAILTEHLTEFGQRQRIPLIIRIDDPWQASAWRAQQFGGTSTLWAADSVGKYEVTARRLLDAILANPTVDQILVAGTSPLTLALCADLAQRQLENEYRHGGSVQGPALTLIGERAPEYQQDHRFSRIQSGLPPDKPQVSAVTEAPTVALLSSLLDSAPNAAVILVDGYPGIDAGTGTRLAARFPATPVYAWDPAAAGDVRVPLVGELRTYRLSMDLPGGQAHDAWERAARLIHDRYVQESGNTSAAAVSWDDLDEFYRDSNRRQVRNALWAVEAIGGHTWNTWTSRPDSAAPATLHGLDPLEQLQRMGFDRQTAMAMARAEHEDWCRFYRAAGWRYGATRDDGRKIHDKLTDWSAVEQDPALLRRALASLTATLTKLRELGYRSRPLADGGAWQTFRRVGTVVAEQRSEPWTWTTQSGDTLTGAAGDWSVRDSRGGDCWSVRDDIFRATYEHIAGDRWRRLGTVQARPAEDGEIIETLEGPVTATAGDMVVRGDHNDQWPVPATEFARRYAAVPTNAVPGR